MAKRRRRYPFPSLLPPPPPRPSFTFSCTEYTAHLSSSSSSFRSLTRSTAKEEGGRIFDGLDCTPPPSLPPSLEINAMHTPPPSPPPPRTPVRSTNRRSQVPIFVLLSLLSPCFLLCPFSPFSKLRSVRSILHFPEAAACGGGGGRGRRRRRRAAVMHV